MALKGVDGEEEGSSGTSIVSLWKRSKTCECEAGPL